MTESCKGHFYHLLSKRTYAHNHVENQKPANKMGLSCDTDCIPDKWRKRRDKSEMELVGGADSQKGRRLEREWQAWIGERKAF